MMLYSVAIRYQHFREPCSPHLQGEDVGSKVMHCRVAVGYHCYGEPCCLHLHHEHGGGKVL